MKRLLVLFLVILAAGWFYYKSYVAPKLEEKGKPKNYLCDKFSQDEMKNYCLGLVSKDASYCLKKKGDDKYTCQAMVEGNPGVCEKISMTEEYNICHLQVSGLYNNIDFCDSLKTDVQREDCYFALISGLYWDRKSRLITDYMCQKFSSEKPGRKTCQALQKRDKSLCEENFSCLEMFSDIKDCLVSSSQKDQNTCFRNVALLSKNDYYCGKITTKEEQNDCYLDYAGHVSQDFETCEKILEQTLREECYLNVIISREVKEF
jgi:hypothetical protein